MQNTTSFTRGRILSPLLRFAIPVLGALILQAMYGAVDLLVVGQFGTPADVSAVSTGSQLMHTITFMITGLSMGTTILLGQSIGAGEGRRSGDIIGSLLPDEPLAFELRVDGRSIDPVPCMADLQE